jgi:acyl-CoA synthetase (AMP-forming)/AMP-acid ligase II
VQRVGGTVVLMERFDARGVLAAIDRFKVTHMQLVPTMMLRILRLPAEERASYDLSSLQRIVHAAAPCPPHVKREFIEWLGPIVDEYYSGTEGSGITYVTSPEWLAHPGTVGRPILGEVHIVDEAGASCGPGEVGAVYFGNGGDYVYRNDPAATEARVGPSGWTTLDDMGYVDEDGYLYLTDRRSHTIIVGGVNVFPREVEDVLLTHPAVADVAVVGVPDEEYGEQIKAIVVLEPPAASSPELADELIAHCRATLSAVKCPRSVDVVASLPRDESGKLRKGALRDQYTDIPPRARICEPYSAP